MDLLVIGGTRFLGRHLVDQALATGHRVTLLHRGRSAPALFPQAEHLIADRDGDLDALASPAGRTWDTVIDTSAYVPRQVRSLARALRGRIGHYQLVSTISVYASMRDDQTDEDAALAELPDPSVEAVTGETYGGLKALCERAAHEAFSGLPVLIARPGLLVGPFDPTGRFTWWVQRLLRGGTVLAPGFADQSVQFIDARDAAAWLLRQSEAHTDGVFNLTGPVAPLTMGECLARSRDLLAPGAELAWVDEAFLLREGVAPWTDLPLWLPSDEAGLHRADIRRALALGLTCRPLEDTLRDTASWLAEAPAPSTAPGSPPRPAVGLTDERERQLLLAWRETNEKGPA